MVTSNSSAEIYTIGKKKRECSCESYRRHKLCAHVIAAASAGRFMHEVLKQPKFKKTTLASFVVQPQSSGKKPGFTQRKRSNCPPQPLMRQNFANVFNDEPVEVLKLKLVYLERTLGYSCHGCPGKMRTSSSASVESPPPHDMVLTTKMIRKSNPKRGGLVIVFSTKPENVYFHLLKGCLKRKSLTLTQDNIEIEEETLVDITDKHREHMMKEFGVFV